MINAIIFDFDGLLADTEKLWLLAEQKVYGRLGVTLSYEDVLETTGLGMWECIEFHYRRHPWEGVSFETVYDWLLDEIIELTCLQGQPKSGATAALDFAASLHLPDGTPLPLAVASSSPCRLLDAAISHFGWQGRFQVVHSASDEAFGKPHPIVYLSTARKLGVLAVDCLAFEDSLNGLIAAKAARMKCIAVPEAHNQHDRRFTLADAVLDSLNDFGPEVWKKISSI